ncbi:PBP1A family penicillin-binding protein [soil metagenome]
MESTFMSTPLPYDPKKTTKRRFWRIIIRLMLIVALLGMAVAAVVLVVYGQVAAQYDLSKLGEMKQRSVVLDCKGREIGKLHGENREVVALDQVSPYFVKALLAREDSRFYDHGGVDYIGVVRALWRDLREQKMVQGASTLTMQLARNSFDDLNAKTAHRKLVEALLARRIEQAKTKDEIIQLYINRIFFGTGLYGIERASKGYFGRPAAQLTLGQSAMIAGIIRSPNRYSPFRNWEGAVRERDSVLDRMVAKKFITQTEATAAKAEDMAVAATPVVHSQENYMMEAVRRDLEVILNSQDIEDGGLTVHTTLDKDIQFIAEQSLTSRLVEVEKLPGYKHMTKAQFDAQWDTVTEPARVPYLQGAIAVVNNSTGGLLAVVGGRDTQHSRFNRALQGNRPIGSTIKPFVYASAIEQGLLPGTLVEDAPIRRDELKDANGYWSPENSDGKFLGMQPATVGLVRSRNAMTVRVGNIAGLDHVLDTIRNVGLGEAEIRTPQVYIGNMGGNLKALTSAMSVFANQGIRRRPFLIERITDGTNENVYTTPVLESQAISRGAAMLTSRMLEKVMKEGTAAAARSEYGFKEKAGGKTGTTNDYQDAWFVGYTSELTCGVWVGLDAPQTIVEGGYGGKLALPVWVDVMSGAVELNYKTTALKAEPMMTKVNLCRMSGKLSTGGCQSAGQEYADELPDELVPQSFCSLHGSGGRFEKPASGKSGGLWSRFKGLFK